MKPHTILAVLFCISLCFLTACGKGDGNCGGDSGGVQSQYSRVFFKARDFGGGDISVEFTDADGDRYGVVQRLNDTWSVPGASCTTSGYVLRVNFNLGKSYTWRAYDRTRSWNGSVSASCDPNSCETVELK